VSLFLLWFINLHKNQTEQSAVHRNPWWLMAEQHYINQIYFAPVIIWLIFNSLAVETSKWSLKFHRYLSILLERVSRSYFFFKKIHKVIIYVENLEPQTGFKVQPLEVCVSCLVFFLCCGVPTQMHSQKIYDSTFTLEFCLFFSVWCCRSARPFVECLKPFENDWLLCQ